MTITRKKKVCKGCGKESHLFSKGLCKACYYTPRVRKEIGLKPLSPLRHRKPSPVKESGNTWGYDGELEMFKDIWENREVDEIGRTFCEFTGKRIDNLNGTQRFIWVFSHVLPKGLYPAYRLNPENIRLVHPDLHMCTENFTKDMIDKHPDWKFKEWFALKEFLKKEYQIFCNNNLIT